MLRQAAGGLVKDDDLGAGADGGRDLQHLLLAGGQIADALPDIELSSNGRQHLFGLLPHRARIEQSP